MFSRPHSEEHFLSIDVDLQVKIKLILQGIDQSNQSMGAQVASLMLHFRALKRGSLFSESSTHAVEQYHSFRCQSPVQSEHFQF
jgi:hypothetical protein